MERLRRIGDELLELLYPSHACCMGCGDLAGTDDGWLCEECKESLNALYLLDAHVCERCGTPIQNQCPCGVCSDWPRDGLRLARFAYGYAPPASQLIRKMKYHSVYRMAEWMGESIGKTIQMGVFGPVDALIPVPMHPKRLHERGRNHALCLAQAASRYTGVPVIEALARVRNTKQQARMQWEKRKASLDAAFSLCVAADSIQDMHLVLIDDVITTGTTANACARVLRATGAKSVCAAAFAGHFPYEKAEEEVVDYSSIHYV